jgi:hypothetical protein
MVEKYFSHVEVWAKMQEGDIFAVFEEDAHFADTARHHLALLDRFIRNRGVSFSILMLGLERNPEPSGKLRAFDIGEGLRLVECRADCALRGTRGYIITYDGARRLLKYTKPVEIQIDSLLSLMARYHKDFRLFWTDTDVALGPSVLEQLHDAVGQDPCVKCHLPTSNVYYIGSWVLIAAFWLILCICKDAPCSCGGGAASPSASREPRAAATGCLVDGALHKRLVAWHVFPRALSAAAAAAEAAPLLSSPNAGGEEGGVGGEEGGAGEYQCGPIREDPLCEDAAADDHH